MFKFNLHDIVKLPQGIHDNLTGIVISIWVTDKATKYEVRYFWEGKPVNDAYFYEWELEKR